jgi:hypothetical protein
LGWAWIPVTSTGKREGGASLGALPLPLWERKKNHHLSFSQVIDFSGEGFMPPMRHHPLSTIKPAWPSIEHH